MGMCHALTRRRARGSHHTTASRVVGIIRWGADGIRRWADSMLVGTEDHPITNPRRLRRLRVGIGRQRGQTTQV